MKRIRSEKERASFGFKVIIGLIILIILAFFISMDQGYTRLAPNELINVLLGRGTREQGLILFDFRLPRIIVSMLLGIGLAVSGCILQGVTKNPLAEPSILGINAGAGFVVVLFIALYPSNQQAPAMLLPVLALLGAGISFLTIYLISYQKGKGISPMTLILSGIGISAGFSSIMTIITMQLRPENYQFVAIWLAGSIYGSNWRHIGALIPWLLILLPFIFTKAKILDILGLGDQTAIGLGIHVEKERRVLIIAAVALAASCVAVGGAIGFIGLLGPHIGRRLVGPGHKLLFPVAALVGALLLMCADTIGRNAFEPAQIPVGIVVAVIGAPYFLYLLGKARN